MLEFAFLMPVIVGMLALLWQAEQAISTAIANQRYARQHMHFLFFNNRYYPERHFATSTAKGTFFQRWWVGVTDVVQEADVEGMRSVAPKRKIGRFTSAEDAASGEPGADTGITKRQNVRIRVTAFTCVSPYGLNSIRPFSENNLGEGQFDAGRFNYCGVEK
jgi:hypothetical protein